MKTYTKERTEQGPFRADAPMERLREFYRANGYELDECDPDEAADRQAVSPDHMVFVRGESRAGWWSSDMTELSSRVEVRRDEQNEAIHIQYRVDVTGQHMTDSDRQFWDRELEAAFDHLRNPSHTPRDLRHEEAKRAERIRRRMLSYGIWGAVIVFLLILLVNVMSSM